MINNMPVELKSKVLKIISTSNLGLLSTLSNSEYSAVIEDEEAVDGLLHSMSTEGMVWMISSLRNMKSELLIVSKILTALTNNLENNGDVNTLVEIVGELCTKDVGVLSIRHIIENSNNLDNSKVASTLIMIKRIVDGAVDNMTKFSTELGYQIKEMEGL